MRMISSQFQARRKAVWGPKRSLTGLLALTFILGLASSGLAADKHRGHPAKNLPGTPSKHLHYKLDAELTWLAERGNPQAKTSVIVELVPGARLPAEFKQFARSVNLDIINGAVLDVPNGMLKKLKANADIFRVHYNRPIQAHNYRTSITVGAPVARGLFGVSGNGVGVAVIDSGIATWHDDLTGTGTYGNQRVAKFVDFVNGQTLPYDDNGHGTHVAGTIAGNGYDSTGEKAGIAPGASIVALKVLDANGQGTVSNIIAALSWIALNGRTYNVRVVNMSVGAGIYESYWTDPLTIAAKRLVEQGVVVVAAAGNLGKNAAGQPQYGGITAPGNAPWVLTVGASSTMGTLTRSDDTLAGFSSAGPTYIDYAAKPDLVAPGVGTVSLAAPGSTFYSSKSQYLVAGSVATAAMPYVTLSGTSMAAPVVSGTVALMLQANPSLTPNLVKAILQYTAQPYPGYNALQEGAGFLNTLGAVTLSRVFAGSTGWLPVPRTWSRTIIWGNHRLSGGVIKPDANAWGTNVVWGAAKTSASGDNIVWGTECPLGACDNIVWGTSLLGFADNIVWGTSFIDDNIVWGTGLLDDNIVWGTDCGGADCDNIVWGTVDADNIVWGTAMLGDNIVWGTSLADDNIVWGTSTDSSSSWGSSGDDETVYPDTATDPVPDPTLEFDLTPIESTDGGI